MNTNSLTAEREHLANLLEAVQRCSHFLNAAPSPPYSGERVGVRGWPSGKLSFICNQELI